MSEHTFHEETDAETGVTLKILLDDGGTESPLENDEAVVMAVFNRRYINPGKDKLIRKPFGGDYWNMGNMEDVQAFSKANAHASAPYAVFPLYMYDHSGTIYRPSQGGNPFSCPWDSGRAGIIALKKSDVGTPGKKYGKGPNAQIGKSYFEQAKLTCEVYTAWANGEVYGFRIEDADGEELDSCWGFIEPDGATGYVLEAARESMAGYVEEAKEAAAKKARDESAMAKEFGMDTTP